MAVYMHVSDQGLTVLQFNVAIDLTIVLCTSGTGRQHTSRSACLLLLHIHQHAAVDGRRALPGICAASGRAALHRRHAEEASYSPPAQV
jgi:hypothetical protein